jgi:hypothetical protein
MNDIQSYLDIGEKMIEHPIFKDKYEIEEPKFPGDSLIEKTLWMICREKDDYRYRNQVKSSTSSITKKLNNLFNTGG